MSKGRHYIEVAPLGAGGGQRSVFTYHSQQPIKTGQVVKVPFGRGDSLGLLLAASQQPDFKTKAIKKAYDLAPLPGYFIELAKWLSGYYATPLARVLTTMLPASPQIIGKASSADPAPERAGKLKLQPQQSRAIKAIEDSKQRSFLLQGITGSGKTQVYIELAAAALSRGDSAIILVPEISLTPQITGHLKARFGNDVLLTHSGLTPAQRRTVWQQALIASQPKVVIGPRSALFSPLASLGYIIIDEAHETSYKQEQAPRYQTTSVAAKLAELTGAKLVLGSATPSAGDNFLVAAKRLQLVAMPERVYKIRTHPPIIVDLSQKAQNPRSSFISKPLLDTLQSTLSHRKQAILFMNRRGTARLSLCTNCRWVATCPNCQIPLTLHADRGLLLCHWCDYTTPPPARCPECGGLEIRFLGGGTKRIEAEINRLLPGAKVARLDKDSFDANTIAALFEQINRGEIDILIGTQMVAKGLDIPNVETIGVVLADTMLYLPDYTSAERTFQLLYQVAGRAGRREDTDAKVVVQTYSPTHPAIQAAATGDYDGFIKSELAERQLLNYPPYVYLLKLSVARTSRKSAQATAAELAAKLGKITGVEVIGPAPAWRETLRGKFHWQIIIKSKVRGRLQTIATHLPSGWTHDLDPINLL